MKKNVLAGIATSLLIGCLAASTALAATVSGKLTIPGGKTVLLNDATVQLAILEKSSDTKGRLIAQSMMAAESSLPLPFSIGYDPTSLKKNKAYEITATVSALNGRLRWFGTAPLSKGAQSPSNVAINLVESDPTAEGVEFFTYDFDGFRILARYGDDLVTLYTPEGAISLPLDVSASGARFFDGRTTFWTKGQEAYFETSGRLLTSITP